MPDALTVLALAKSNRSYRRALESDRRYVQACKVREQALTAQLTLPTVPRPASPSLDVDVPINDWLEEVVAADTAKRARETKAAALRNLIRDCDGEIAAAASMDPDRLIRCFADELNELLGELEPVVRRLGGARSAGAAVNVGDDAVAAWRLLPEFHTRYQQLRDAQMKVMQHDHIRVQNAQSPVFADEVASDLVARNWDEVFPAWRDQDTTVYVSGEARERRPWPLNDVVAQLVWRFTSGLELWIPTRSELDALHAERRARKNRPPEPAEPESPKRPARAAYSPGLLG